MSRSREPGPQQQGERPAAPQPGGSPMGAGRWQPCPREAELLSGAWVGVFTGKPIRKPAEGGRGTCGLEGPEHGKDQHGCGTVASGTLGHVNERP